MQTSRINVKYTAPINEVPISVLQCQRQHRINRKNLESQAILG